VIDSDADGLPNFYDAFPLDPDTTLALTDVTLSRPAGMVSFSWMAKPNTVYRVEYTADLGSGDWHFLRNYTNSSATLISAVVQDALSSGSAQRYYRVRSVE
jgi:hypothetical protein